ncbi:DUF3488 domain-containing protein, partial [Halovivax sp.]|uniref:DUF3488 domain-containing protein n=1 Tax=Halovivax sp. TaxID=1935978 RepID=UPI0025C0ABEB
MSTGAVDRFGRDVGAAFPGADRSPSSLAFRGLALACSLVLVGSTLLVLREITGVVGGTNSLYAIVAAALATGTVAAAILRERTAAAFALVVAAIGFAYYFTAAGVGVAAALSHLDKIVSDTITLATGLELLRMVEAGTWALAFAPAPAFLTWYLALRRRYALAVVPGGLALSFLVLTGDAGTTVTLAGTVAGIGVVGFGELERRGGTIGQADALAVLLAAMMLLSLAIPLVPGGSSDPAHLIDGEGPGTLEGSVVGAEDRSTIEGSVSLSPEVRYTIESDEPAYWRTNVYDRFTGDEWVVSGEHGPYDGRLAPPPGDGRPLVQEVAVEADIQAMPMANHPIAVDDGVGEFVEVTDHDQFRPTVTLTSDDSYTVESAVIDPDPDELRAAGTDYPAEFDRDRYLQQPEDVSTAFEERTSEIVDG